MSYNETYVLMNDSGTYPYEIYVYDPRGSEKEPEWLSDILKLEKFDNNIPIYQKSVDSHNNITYQIPGINGHLNVPSDCIIAYNLGNKEVFSIRSDAFKSLYKKKSNRIYALFKKLFRS